MISDGRLDVNSWVAELVARVKKEEDFRKGVFATHLENFSGVGAHCLQMHLSAAVDGRFMKPCSHTRSDGTIGAAPKTMAQLLGRRPRPSDWNDRCHFCFDVPGKQEESGNAYKCSHCNVVMHKICIERSHWDLPSSPKGEWTCPECIREISECRHDVKCDRCNERSYIADDVLRTIQLLASLEKSAAGPVTDPASTSSQPVAKNRATKKARTSTLALLVPVKGSGRDVLMSEMLSARLEQFVANEQMYVSHLIQDRNQDCFK